MEEDKKIVEEKMKQNVADVEASVKKMEDFTSPTELYRTLVEGVKRYHPSDDLTLIDKAYRVADEAHRGRNERAASHISSTRCVWRSSLPIWSWTRKPLFQVFSTMWWRTRS